MSTKHFILVAVLFGVLFSGAKGATLKDDFAKAYDLIEAGEVEQALTSFDKIVTANPKEPEVYLRRGKLRSLLGNFDGAIKDYTEVIKLEPRNEAAWNGRILAYSKNGDDEKALQDCNQLINFEKLPANFCSRAIVLKNLGRLDEAVRDYTEALKVDPKYYDALRLRGKIHAERAEFETAILDFNAAIALAPKDPANYSSRAECYDSMDRPSNAIQDYTKAILFEPDEVGYYAKRGRLYSNKGEHGKALADFAVAIEKDPEYENTYIYRGLHRMARAEHDMALADYNQALELNPESQFALLCRAKLLLEIGQLTAALGDANKLIQLAPKSEYAQIIHGNCLLFQRRFDDALTKYDKAVEFAPESAEARERRISANLVRGSTNNLTFDVQKWFKIKGWTDVQAPNAAIKGYFAYRACGNTEAARRLLEDAGKFLRTENWPAPILTYLRGTLTSDELLKQAAKPAEKTQAHLWIGMNELSTGQRESARKNFLAVQKFAEKSSEADLLATERLKKLEARK
jgi:tetratricopeptide (TPR) repeat protein